MSHRTADLSSMWTTVGGLRLHARVPARQLQHGLPVVLVHGLTVSSRYMTRLLPRLAPHYPVFAPDLPGFGLSEKPLRALDIPALADALADWMDAVGIREAALVGQSMGCQTIAEFGVRYPGRLVAAALVGPSMDRRGRTPLEQARRLMIDGAISPPSAVLIMLRDFIDFGAVRTLRTLHYALRHRIEERLPLLRAPALIIRGERDVIAPQRWVEELVRLLPAGELALVPGAPHATQYAAPDATARLVTGLLARRGIRAPAG